MSYAKMVGVCVRKVGYDGRALAEQARGNDGTRVVYRCPVCERFHLGRPHARANFRRSKRRGL